MRGRVRAVGVDRARVLIRPTMRMQADLDLKAIERTAVKVRGFGGLEGQVMRIGHFFELG